MCSSDLFPSHDRRGRPRASRKPYRNLLKVGSYAKRRTTYMRSTVRASYSKDEEKNIMIAQLALVLLNMVLVMQIQQQQQMQLQVSVLKQIIGMVSILINH